MTLTVFVFLIVVVVVGVGAYVMGRRQRAAAPYSSSPTIAPFSIALIVGIIVGTYSSIYVASTTLLELGVSKFDLLAVEKEGAQVDQRP